MYQHPDRAECRRLVRFLRQLWRGAHTSLLDTLKLIVDPPALSLIILNETKKITKQVIISGSFKLTIR